MHSFRSLGTKPGRSKSLDSQSAERIRTCVSDNQSQNERPSLRSKRRPLGSSICEGSELRPDARRVSQTRTPQKQRGSVLGSIQDPVDNLRARYWGYLLENVKRAIDDLYITCEVCLILECFLLLLSIDYTYTTAVLFVYVCSIV